MVKKKGRPGRPGGHRPRTLTVLREGDTINLSLDFLGLDPPEQEFEADVMWATVRRGAVSLMLDRLSLADESVVEGRVEMRLSFEAFGNFWTATRQDTFLAPFRKWVESHPGTEAPATDGGTKAPASRAVLRAHLARVSYVETDAELMFYGYPISAMSQVINLGSDSVPIHGVLRVTCTTETLARFMAACAEVAPQVPSRSGKGVS